jgi:hypothetical protein
VQVWAKNSWRMFSYYSYYAFSQYLDKLPQPGFRLNSFLVDGKIENEENENNIEIELNLKEITKSQLTTKSTEKTPQKRKLSTRDINKL